MLHRIALALLLTSAACTPVPPCPLAGVARRGDLDSIRRLVHNGADLNERSGVNGWTPLEHAVHKAQLDSLKLLLELGADPNAASPKGVTPLMMAAGYGYEGMVRVLLEHKANVSLKNGRGETALNYARHGIGDIDRWTYPNEQSACVRLLEKPPVQ
jgi:hypothetical protein